MNSFFSKTSKPNYPILWVQFILKYIMIPFFLSAIATFFVWSRSSVVIYTFGVSPFRGGVRCFFGDGEKPGRVDCNDLMK